VGFLKVEFPMFPYPTAADLSSPFVSDFKICTSLLIAPLVKH
jgi:hypothetical protein